jgi:hypothetical protein
MPGLKSLYGLPVAFKGYIAVSPTGTGFAGTLFKKVAVPALFRKSGGGRNIFPGPNAKIIARLLLFT